MEVTADLSVAISEMVLNTKEGPGLLSASFHSIGGKNVEDSNLRG
jgi:hypothetical protein